MPIKLELDNLPEKFTLVSSEADGRRAIVTYPELIPPHNLIHALMAATHARSVGVMTPHTDNKLHFHLSSARGPAYEDRDDILDLDV
jgi:hypothetical protein